MVSEYRDFDEFINRSNGFSKVPKEKLFGQAFAKFA